LKDDNLPFADRLLSPKQVCIANDIGSTTFWKRLTAGEYGEPIRDGKNVKVTGAAILARRERLPKATFSGKGCAPRRSESAL